MRRSPRVFFIALILSGGLCPQQGHTTVSSRRVVILGDSITEGLGVAHEEAFPFVLQSLLSKNGYKNVEVINAGVSGSTTSSGLSRLKWQLHSPPEIVVLELGANDMLRGQPAELAKKNLAAMIRLALQAHVKVLLAGMKVPPNYGKEYERNFERIYPQLGQTFHVPLIPFLLEGVAGDRSLNQGDSIHPNADGHKKVAALVYRYLQPLL